MDLSVPLCVFTLLLVGYSYAQELILNPATDELTKSLDSSGFSFVCNVIGLAEGEGADLKWKDPRGNEVASYDMETNFRLYVLNLFQNEITLQFDELTGDENAGTYTCEASIKGKQLSKSIKLTLTKTIKVLSPNKQSPVVNTTALIECKTSFAKPPTIKWLHGATMKQVNISLERYKQEPEGLMIKDITQADNGIYVCAIFTDNRGDSKFFRITVTVTVPPRMKAPPSISDPIVGREFTMTCAADGTPKPEFFFQKDGVTIVDGGRYEVTVNKNSQIDQSEGMLRIETLEDNDEGDYKCIAKNLGGQIEEELFVNIIVPPTIAKIASDSKEEGQSAQLVCQARSDPVADVQWKITGTDISITNDKANGITIEESSEEGDRIFIRTRTLKFNPLKQSHTNNYTCIASNAAGTDKKIGSITVKFVPNFKNTPYSATYGWVNHDTEIKCVVDAVPDPTIIWYKNNKELTDGGSYSISRKEGVRQFTSILTVRVDIQNEGTIFGDYMCEARNMVGRGTHNITLKKAKVPGKPSVSFGDVTATSIELFIRPPADNGGQPVIDFKIEYNPEGQPSNVSRLVADVSKDPNEARSRSNVISLTARTKYTIRVASRNNVGYGSEATVTQTTKAISEPSPPEIKSPIKSSTANEYTLMWEKPNTGGAPITGYTIKYRQVELNDKRDVVRHMTDTKTIKVGGGVTSKKLTQLNPDADYELQLVAINFKGESMASTLLFKTLPGGSPSTGGAVSMHVGLLSSLLLLLPAALAVKASLW